MVSSFRNSVLVQPLQRKQEELVPNIEIQLNEHHMAKTL